MSQKEKGGYAGPSPEEERASAEEYWNTYSGWIADEDKRLEGDLARNRVRQAAGGAVGDDRYETGRRASYKESIEGLKGGAHGTSLQQYFDKQKGQRIAQAQQQFKVNRTPITGGIILPGDRQNTLGTDMVRQGGRSMSDVKQIGVRDKAEQAYVKSQGQKAKAAIDKINEQTMEDFYTAEFGAYQAGPGDAEQEALDRAKGIAGGGRSGAAASASGGEGSAGGDQKPLGLANWFV